MLMSKCLLAMLIQMLVILMLILMLVNLNTCYFDTDADLCIRIMSLCCTHVLYHTWFKKFWGKKRRYLFKKQWIV